MAENKEMAGLKRRISSRRNACGAKTRCKTSGGAAHLERLSLYDDKEGPEILAEQASSFRGSWLPKKTL